MVVWIEEPLTLIEAGRLMLPLGAATNSIAEHEAYIISLRVVAMLSHMLMQKPWHEIEGCYSDLCRQEIWEACMLHC